MEEKHITEKNRQLKFTIYFIIVAVSAFGLGLSNNEMSKLYF